MVACSQLVRIRAGRPTLSPSKAGCAGHALAGAQESVLGASSAEACQVASDVARANDARLTGCDVGPGSVITVDAESEVRLPLAAISPPAMRGRAKAGPAPDGS